MTNERKTEQLTDVFSNSASGGGSSGGSGGSTGSGSGGGWGGGDLSKQFNEASDARRTVWGESHWERTTPATRAADSQYSDHYFTSREARTHDEDLIGKTTNIHERESGDVVASKHGNNGKKPASEGFNQGLFNWLSKR